LAQIFEGSFSNMRVWMLKLCVLLGIVASIALGQVGNGTITGTVTDPAGAVVPGANVEATNSATGVVYSAVSTNTGAYTIASLPIGSYVVSVKQQGFKTYTHSNLAVGATQTLRENVTLEVGSASESITVTAEASLLKTEAGDMTHNVSLDTLNQLPLLGIGTANSGTSGVRNPYNALQTIPGVSSYASSGQFTMNGLGGNMSETMRVEGQDATSRLFNTYNYTQMAQPSADAIQEVAFQASNYSAEFGQAGSVVINMTMKSGTNQYHGTGYDYFVNEDLNAGNPFSASTVSGKYRPRNRRNDFGGTLGGPVVIPKLYNGRNKTFFFFNYEQFLETTQYGFTDTVPTAAYLKGDFSAISPNGNCSLCSLYGIPTGPLGSPTPQLDAFGKPTLFANEIYDPLTRNVNPANNLGYANPFPNNVIPLTRIDNVAQKVIPLLPTPSPGNSNLIGNYGANISGGRYTAIPSIKVDQNLSDKDKLSFFYTRINTESQISSPLGNADGLPITIGAYRGTFIPTYTTRLNYDRTLAPTLLLHIGVGYYKTRFDDHAPFTSFVPSTYGLSGFVNPRQFPSFTGNCVIPIGQTACTGYGGLQNIGTSGQIQTLNYEEKPSFNANLTWVKGNHTFKGGAELYLEQVYNGSFAGVTLNTGATSGSTGVGATAQPFTPTGSLAGFTQGFGFANFLLGDYTSTAQTPQLNYRQGNQQWGVFIQDTWKVTRKLTLDYGIRYDLSTTYKEQYGRLGQFAATLPNANAGGHPGATIYANTCNCNFYQPIYPYAVGPRLGVAYQLTPKTVLRGGFGVNYQFIAATAGGTVTTNGAYPLNGINPFVNIETPGSIVAPAWPVTDNNRFPTAGTTTGLPVMPDANQNRPPRVTQYSIGVQRELTRDLLIEGSYIGNRGVWEQGATFGSSGPLGYQSQISPAMYAAYSLYPYPGTGPCGSGGGAVCASSSYNNYADYLLLSQAISSTAVVNRMAAVGIKNLLPYSGFPTSNSLQSVIRPFPQFPNTTGAGINPTGSATGNSHYDGLQIKLTKRYSRGLQVNGAYTWAKGFVRNTPQDFFNPNSSSFVLQNIPPQTLTFNVTYTVQKMAFLDKVKFANTILKDWQVGFFATYQSGTFLTPPGSTTANLFTSEQVRVPGVPLYLKNVNDIHNYNPYYDQILNPAAWQQVSTNGVGPAVGTLYSDFRGPRQPKENANIGRHFRIKERMDFYIRGEFVNIFNRTIMPNPSAGQLGGIIPQNALQKNGLGYYTAGFGIINAYQAPGTSTIFTGRTGTLIAKFQF
jgi:hypothetical protein